MTEDNRVLADLLFPHTGTSPDVFESVYPSRTIDDGAFVTRFAPSPTGFIHIGSIYAALISERVAQQSDGIFILRVEDTDKKREVEGGVTEIVDSLKLFRIPINEGRVDANEEVGNYGPYIQSERMDMYRVMAKHLVAVGHAYPCFCSEQELKQLRERQESNKVRPGYYGEWAVHRNMSVDDIRAELAEGKPFVIRLRSSGQHTAKFDFHDLVKGHLEVPENDQDAVLLKSDGLPTYHFAHVVDDHFMRTTHVIRGDEWLSSVPLHVELFQVFGWTKPHFAHIAPILKEEGQSRRKLSKRKDPEAAVRYYDEQGFPQQSVVEYLLTLANSDFEDWRHNNPTADNSSFKLRLEHMSTSGSLFDMVKLLDISKDVVAKMTAKEVYDESLKWARKYDPCLADLLKDEPNCIGIFGIERSKEQPRKDLAKWSDVRSQIEYFFDELFDEKQDCNFPEDMSTTDIRKTLEHYEEIYDISDQKTVWFEKIRDMASSMGYARDVKTYKKNPSQYKGHVGYISAVLRIAITGRKNTPDLWEIMRVMGTERVARRLRQSNR